MERGLTRRAGFAGAAALLLGALTLGGCRSGPSENDFQWAAITSNTLRIMALEAGAGQGRDHVMDVQTTESVPTYASTSQLNVPAGGEAELTITLDKPTNGSQTFLFYCSSLGVVCSPLSVTVDTGASESFSVRVRACTNAQAGSYTWMTCKNANGQGSVTLKVVIQ
ncbi:MAG: hypothetical protein KJZ54_04670 [Phycisphaerales bacterium]|nr:hypothetical protein [Phycisphaerales bacterium]